MKFNKSIFSLWRKIAFLILIGLLTINSISSFAQKKQDTQAFAFTPAKMDNVQVWFLAQTDSLQLSDENREKYINKLGTKMNSIFHLTDNDSKDSKAEIKEKTKWIFNETAKNVKPMLTKQ